MLPKTNILSWREPLSRDDGDHVIQAHDQIGHDDGFDRAPELPNISIIFVFSSSEELSLDKSDAVMLSGETSVNVFTIEPGIYFIPELFEKWKNEKSIRIRSGNSLYARATPSSPFSAVMT